MAIRRATADEVEAVRELTRYAYAKWVAVIGREPLPMTADHHRAIREHQVDLLIDKRELVALVEMILRPDDVLIENLAVLPERQGEGLGDTLLAHAADVAGRHRRPLVRLYTNAQFTANLRFYEKRGFLFEREEAFRSGTVVHMVRPVRAG